MACAIKKSAIEEKIAKEVQSVKGKKFIKLRDGCLKKNLLFEDPDFLASDTYVIGCPQFLQNFFANHDRKCFEWLRPKEILARRGSLLKAEFIVEGASRFDINQGKVGNCWLLAALACLTQHPQILDVIVPPDQSFDENYAGIFRFNFWVFGEWKEVVVDDKLPTINGQMIFLHSKTENEFWSALFEKAYAKLVGSYDAMNSGNINEGFEDLTGGIAEEFKLEQYSLLEIQLVMMKAFERRSLMGASITKPISPNKAFGLNTYHAYSVTGVKKVELVNSKEKIALVRLRNPWGSTYEWTGPWSDRSEKWALVSEEEKKNMEHLVSDDGEFWMSLSDFQAYFTNFQICHLGPEDFEYRNPITDEPWKKWCMKEIKGSWKDSTAGGCPNYASFWSNPQYPFEVVHADEHDDKGLGTVIVALMQKDKRKLRAENLSIGFYIFECDVCPMKLNPYECKRPAGKSGVFINLREVCQRFKLKPGKYCLIPCSYDPNEEGEFLIRIISEKPVSADKMT